MIVDGRGIAKELKERLKEEVRALVNPPMLFIFSVGENPVSERFVSLKKKFAADVGIRVIEKKFDEKASTARVVEGIKSVVGDNVSVVVQLPLPPHIETKEVLNAIPPECDPDVLSEKSIALYEKDALPILPPVVMAIKEILFQRGVFVGNRNVVIVGRGKLVGAPAAVWFKRHGSNTVLLGRDTLDLKIHTTKADIIILGTGNPGLLKPDMIKPGVVVLDAGTSETEGKLAGDADPKCAERASVFTPVPGGIGPVTVAMLFANIVILAKARLLAT